MRIEKSIAALTYADVMSLVVGSEFECADGIARLVSKSEPRHIPERRHKVPEGRRMTDLHGGYIVIHEAIDMVIPASVTGSFDVVCVTDEDRNRVRQTELIARALGLLSGTDHVVTKAAEGAVTLSDDWKQWRQWLRDVVNGLHDSIPDEPSRYANPAPAPEPWPKPTDKLADWDKVGAADASSTGEAEPMPDALARLVPGDMDAAAKRLALLNRWIYLNALLNDMTLPPDKRKTDHDITPAERAELDQLNTYKGWFS